MKKLITTLGLCLCSMLHVPCAAYAQTIPPPYINYQAVLYDVNSANPNAVLADTSLSTYVNILDELGNLLYKEEHYASTDANGLITVKMGDGLYTAGPITNFNLINWGVGKYYLVVDFVINGTTSSTAPEQLVTVPYSFYAGKAGNGMTTVADNGNGTLTFTYANGSTYTTPTLAGIQGDVGPAGTNGTNGLNALINTTTEFAGSNCPNGGTKIETGLDENGNGILDAVEVNASQTKYVCNGEGDADNDPINELQTIALSNDTLYISNGNSVFLGNLSGVSSGGSYPTGTISYPMANHMFYTPTNGYEGELVVPGNTTMNGVYNFTKFHLESSGVINIGSEAFLLIKADTIIIDGTINGYGLWANGGTGGGAGGGGGGIAHAAFSCYCAGNSGYNSGLYNGFETLKILSGGAGGGATLATYNGSPGQSCDTSSVLEAIDLNLTMKGSRGMDGKLSCGGTCNYTSRLGGNGGAGIIFVSNYIEINNSAIIDISGNNGANYGGGAGGGGNLIIKSNQFGALNGTIDVSGGISSLSGGGLGKGGNGGSGLVLFMTP